jgi:uncharacterized membrane protein YagU involved in acid resistance
MISAMSNDTSVTGDLVRGAIGGAVGTWVMDLVTTALMDQASEADKAQEAAARPNGKSSAANLVDRITATTGLDLDDRAQTQAATIVHWSLGIVPGALYGLLRRRVPGVAAARGLVFGAAVFGLNDEYLNTALGLSAPPEAYPPSTHVRGFVGHLVLGATTDLVCDVLGA